MAADFKLDGVRAHVLAGARFQELLDTAREVQVTVLVKESLVACLVVSVGGKYLRIEFGHAVVPAENAFALDQDFAVVADFHVQVAERLADGAGLVVGQAVCRYHGATFRHAVAFAYGNADVQQKAQYGLVQGGTAAHDELEVPADGVSHLAVDQFVVEPVDDGAVGARGCNLCDLDGVVDNVTLDAFRVSAGGRHAFVEAFEDSRDYDHPGRANFLQDDGEILGAIGKVDGRSVKHVEVDDHAFQHVCDGEHGKCAVGLGVHGVELAQVVYLHEHIPVTQVGAFGESHRAARIDDAEQVVGMDHLDLVIHPAVVFALFAEPTAPIYQVVPVDGVFGQGTLGVNADD